MILQEAGVLSHKLVDHSIIDRESVCAGQPGGIDNAIHFLMIRVDSSAQRAPRRVVPRID